jgi:hypothetical protein
MRTMVWEQAGAQTSWLEDNDSGTKEYLLMLCNMNVWEEMSDNAVAKLDTAESNHKEYVSLYKEARARREENLKYFERVQVRKAEWVDTNHNKINEYQQELTCFTNQLDRLGDEPYVRPKPVDNHKRKHDEINKRFGAIKHEKDSSERKARKHYDVSDSHQYSIDLMTHAYNKPAPPPQNLHAAIEEMGIRKQQQKLLNKAQAMPTKCPTCNQSMAVRHIPQEELDLAAAEFETSKQLVMEEEKKGIAHKKKIEQEESRLKKIKLWQDMAEARREYVCVEKEYNGILKERCESVTEEVRWNEEVIKHCKWETERNEIVTCVRMLRQNIERLAAEGNPMDVEERDIVEKLNVVGKNVKRYEELSQRAKYVCDKMSNIKKWCGTKGIQTYVVESLLFKISSYTTDWCKRLFDEESQGSPTFVMKIGDKEMLEKTLQFGESSAAKALSGGQYRRLQIAAFMAWRALAEVFTGIHVNLLMLDEAGSNVDVVGFRQMEQALKEWSNDKRTCMFISHDTAADKGSMLYDTHIEIRATKEGSEVYDHDKSL